MLTGTKFNNFPAFILREVGKSVSSLLHCSPFLPSASSSGGIRLFVMKVCRDAWEITSFHLLRNGIQVNQERSQPKIKGIANSHSFTANLRIVLTFTGLCFVLRKESSTDNRPFSVVHDWIGASKLSLPFPAACAAV